MLRQTLIATAARAPLLPGADQVVFVGLDSTHRQVNGYAKHVADAVAAATATTATAEPRK